MDVFFKKNISDVASDYFHVKRFGKSPNVRDFIGAEDRGIIVICRPVGTFDFFVKHIFRNIFITVFFQFFAELAFIYGHFNCGKIRSVYLRFELVDLVGNEFFVIAYNEND